MDRTLDGLTKNKIQEEQAQNNNVINQQQIEEKNKKIKKQLKQQEKQKKQDEKELDVQLEKEEEKILPEENTSLKEQLSNAGKDFAHNASVFLMIKKDDKNQSIDNNIDDVQNNNLMTTEQVFDELGIQIEQFGKSQINSLMRFITSQTMQKQTEDSMLLEQLTNPDLSSDIMNG